MLIEDNSNNKDYLVSRKLREKHSRPSGKGEHERPSKKDLLKRKGEAPQIELFDDQCVELLQAK